MKKTLLLGIGNILISDEGIGIHVINKISNYSSSNVEYDILDGGTGGFNLLYIISEYDNVVIVDAIMDKKKTGTISVRYPKYSKDFPDMLSAHDFGLKAMIDSLIFMGKLPNIIIITVSINSNLQEIKLDISPELKKSMQRICNISQYVAALTVKYKEKEMTNIGINEMNIDDYKYVYKTNKNYNIKENAILDLV